MTRPQETVDEAYLLACRCGRVEAAGEDTKQKRQITRIAELLREYASVEVKDQVKREQIGFDLDRLNGRKLNLLTDEPRKENETERFRRFGSDLKTEILTTIARVCDDHDLKMKHDGVDLPGLYFFLDNLVNELWKSSGS